MASSDVLVLGGGLAGLSCATALAEAGVSVALLEKKPHLGGRAYSFKDPATGQIVDNGQHLFMGCYRQTRAFLRRIGSEHLLRFPEGLRVDYAEPGGRRDRLECPSFLPAPLHLARGILGLSGLTAKDKLGLWKFHRAMRKGISRGGSDGGLDRVTVRQWLGSMGLSERMQTRLFDPIAIGALNDVSERASALGFSQVLKEMFYGGEESSRLGLASTGLSELYVEQSRRLIESRNGRVELSRKVSSILEDRGQAVGVETDLGDRYFAGAIVSTLPPWNLTSVSRPSSLRGEWSSWKAVPIIGIHVWLDRPVFQEPLFGLLGTQVHWAFNKSALWNIPGDGQYLSLVVSGADRVLECSPQKIWEMAHDEMSECFPEFRKAKVLSWKVIKEPFATPRPSCGSDALRPSAVSPIPNFFYAGDWTQTGLPATIESAVASGHSAARLALEVLKPGPSRKGSPSQESASAR